MAVSRISEDAILKMLKGDVHPTEELKCVIKFYSNGCHLCHALSSYYRDISNEYEDVLFFAYNVDDDDAISNKLNLNGVPSISMFKVKKGRPAKTLNLPDPDIPNDKTWFTVKQIKNFIERDR